MFRFLAKRSEAEACRQSLHVDGSLERTRGLSGLPLETMHNDMDFSSPGWGQGSTKCRSRSDSLMNLGILKRHWSVRLTQNKCNCHSRRPWRKPFFWALCWQLEPTFCRMNANDLCSRKMTGCRATGGFSSAGISVVAFSDPSPWWWRFESKMNACFMS